MKKITILDETGKKQNAFVTESSDELEKQIRDDRRQNLKEHLYMGYLIIGTIAFTLGIIISYKKLNGGK